jgi:Tfp pilus assembly protein PilX
MSNRNGLALLVALMLMATLVALAFTLASLANLESRHMDASVRRWRLRQAAQDAACAALAEAQARLGPDVAHDYAGTSGGLVVANASGRWEMAGAFDAGPFRCSWEASDLSLCHDASARYVAATQASAWAKTSAGRAKLPRGLAEVVTSSQRTALAIGDRGSFGQVASPGTSWQVRGLLTDPVRGGWRRNLSDETAWVAEVGRPIAELTRGASFGMAPAKGYPLVRVEDGSRTLTTLPVMTDFRLSLGFFNSRSDGRHRLRFHGSMVFWNPLTVPVLAGPQGKMFLVEVVGSPEVTVTNLETQSSFVADLDDCPQEDFGIIRQGLRERGLWFWAEVADPAMYGMAGRGLLPGEVYALVNPSPDTQPQGLSRILTRMTWRMDRAYHGPGWKRTDPEVFLPSDRIEIAVRFRDKVGIRLRPYAGEPAREDAIADYPSSPIMSVEHVVFPDFLIRTTGEDYSREDSAGYVIGERRACLRVRRKTRDVGETFADPATLVRGSWDLDLPTDAAAWTVDHPVLAALDVVDQDASPLAGPFWDLRANRHDAAAVGAFASIRMRDLPNPPWLSVGALRHLEPVGSKAWMARLDAAFFGAAPGAAEAGVVSHDPFLELRGQAVSADAPDAARAFQVIGPFNVNSRDPKAWEAFLRDSAGRWKPYAGGPFEPQGLAGALFFTRPGGAALAKWGSLSEVDLADSAMASLSDLATTGLAEQQCVRKIDDAKLEELSRRIVELQPTHGWPYPSVQAFAEADVLGQALTAAGFDAPCGSAPTAWPVWLRAEDLLEAWAPVLTVRGDTLGIIGRAEGQGGSCVCEMVVQRFAEEHPATHLGRRFRIISVRFRNR